MRTFSEIMKEERKRAGMTQDNMAEVLSCSRYRVADMERGKITPTPEDVNLICNHFNISADYLYGRTPVRAPDPEKTLDVIRTHTGLSERAIAMLHEPSFPLAWWDHIGIQNQRDELCGLINRIIEEGVLHSALNEIVQMQHETEEKEIRSAAFEAAELFTAFVVRCRAEHLARIAADIKERG